MTVTGGAGELDSGAPPGVPTFPNYPKQRPPLPEAYQGIYSQHYLANREGSYRTTSLSQRLEAWMHRQVAADVRDGSGRQLETLEVGAGTLNHLRFEAESAGYDIVEPFRELFDGSDRLGRIRSIYADVEEIPDRDPARRYDRIVSVATFEHIVDLPRVVARTALLLRDDGVLRAAIPNEGTLLWGLGTRVTGFEFQRRYGLAYSVLMRYEHLSTADEIDHVLRAFFEQVDRRVLGPSRRLAFYRAYACRAPRTMVAQAFLAQERSGGSAQIPSGE